MDIKEVVEKLKAVEGAKEILTDDVVAELETVIPKSEAEKLAKAKAESDAKAARILNEKKSSQQKLEELQKEIEDIKGAGLSDLEKLEKALEKANEARERAIQEAQEKDVALRNTMRNFQLEKITNSVKFLDAVPWDMRINSINQALSEVEDLSDETAVNEIMSKYKEDHAGVLASENTPKGSGSLNGAKVVSKSKDPSSMSDDERAKHLRDKGIA